MNAEHIKELMKAGRKFSEIGQEEAIAMLKKQIVTVYLLNGLHRQITAEMLDQEAMAAANCLYVELVSDPLYSGIRDNEIAYIFMEGTKGRLGSDKDIVLTAKSLLRWMDGYLKHDERKLAVNKLVEERYVEPSRQITNQRVYTDEERRASILEALEDYKHFKLNPPPTTRGKGPRRMNDLMPFSVRDFGGRKKDYLVANGYASDDESFEDIMERALRNGGDPFVEIKK